MDKRIACLESWRDSKQGLEVLVLQNLGVFHTSLSTWVYCNTAVVYPERRVEYTTWSGCVDMFKFVKGAAYAITREYIPTVVEKVHYDESELKNGGGILVAEATFNIKGKPHVEEERYPVSACAGKKVICKKKQFKDYDAILKYIQKQARARHYSK
jgi:hypothetical protein